MGGELSFPPRVSFLYCVNALVVDSVFPSLKKFRIQSFLDRSKSLRYRSSSLLDDV